MRKKYLYLQWIKTENNLLNYPIGIQSFEDLRYSKCVYVDKTDYVYNLAYHGKTYFLARPPSTSQVSKATLRSTQKTTPDASRWTIAR